VQTATEHTAGVTASAERTGAAAGDVRGASVTLSGRTARLNKQVAVFLAEIRAA
jgi:methyl-accepting chemotaxis protein